MDLSALLDYCSAVYAQAPLVAGPLGRDGAGVYVRGEQTVLAFRGTLTGGPGTGAILDWLNDCDAELVPDAGFPGRVHEGFRNALNDLWDAIDLALKTTPADNDLIITGHSKGGALATLAGQRLAYLSPRVFTFAAPKAGDEAFALKYAPYCCRLVNPKDVVPNLPPCGYRHVGDLITPPLGWVAPTGFALNHHLETGYRPWIAPAATPEAA